jgi:hypothetical protein
LLPNTHDRYCAAPEAARVALYAEGIKWLNWAVEMLEGKKTEFHGVQVKLPAKE